jgi:hypothetical protein
MKKKSFLTDLVFFICLSFLFSISYYFFNKKEIDKTKDYEFIVYSIIGASSVIFVPLIQKMFKKNDD